MKKLIHNTVVKRTFDEYNRLRGKLFFVATYKKVYRATKPHYTTTVTPYILMYCIHLLNHYQSVCSSHMVMKIIGLKILFNLEINGKTMEDIKSTHQEKNCFNASKFHS